MIDAAFIAIDIQNDFCPGGALAVADGDAVVPVVNRIANRFRAAVLTQDWHPRGHVSFATSHPGAALYSTVKVAGIDQTLWPDHCVAGGPGAGFHPDLDQTPFRLVVRKGVTPGLDSYSAFFENDGTTETGLDGWLTSFGFREVWLAGLATDYCVFYSAMDALRLGYRVVVVEDATRAVGVPPGSKDKAIADMKAAGARFVLSGELA